MARSIGAVLKETADRKLLSSCEILMEDWAHSAGERIEGKHPTHCRVIIDASQVDRINLTVKHPDIDVEIAHLWVEFQAGRLIVHAYDSAHDEPVNLKISATDIEVDRFDRDAQSGNLA